VFPLLLLALSAWPDCREGWKNLGVIRSPNNGGEIQPETESASGESAYSAFSKHFNRRTSGEFHRPAAPARLQMGRTPIFIKTEMRIYCLCCGLSIPSWSFRIHFTVVAAGCQT